MNLVEEIKNAVQESIEAIYQKAVSNEALLINETKAEFEGDFTLVTFSLSKLLGKKPDEIADELGKELVDKFDLFTSYNVIKGFLNLTINHQFYISFLNDNWHNTEFGLLPANHTKVMVEYSSPNTNKPLHFGHLRNIFLGASIANILDAAGYDVIKANPDLT